MKRNSWWILTVFLYVWLMVGFATGTATLLGPVQWITAAAREAGWTQTGEDRIMIAVIAAYVLASLLLSRWLVRRMMAFDRRRLRLAVPLGVTLLAGLALWGWMNPAVYARAAGGGATGRLETAGGAEFLFGAYPDRQKLLELKRQGVTAVVSLQHPAVVPFEPQGIAAEKEAAAEVGIRFIHAPMLPWVSENETSLEKLRELARSGTGKYYVHCGLGRDRVNVAKAVLERMGATKLAETDDLVPARTFGDRVAERKFLMERGNFQVVQDELYLVPYPNRYEGFGKLFGGQVERVVLLLDPDDPQQREWQAEAVRLFEQYAVPYEFLPLRSGDAAAAGAAARLVRRLPRPTVVIVPFTPPCPATAVADAFLRAYHRVGGPAPADVQPGEGWAEQEGRPLPCETAA